MFKETLVRIAAAATAALAMSGIVAAVTPNEARGTVPDESTKPTVVVQTYLESEGEINYPEGDIYPKDGLDTEVCDPSGEYVCILPLPAPIGN